MSKSLTTFLPFILLGMQQRWWQAKSSILSNERAKFIWQSSCRTLPSSHVSPSTLEANYLWPMSKRKKKLGKRIRMPCQKEKLQVRSFIRSPWRDSYCVRFMISNKTLHINSNFVVFNCVRIMISVTVSVNLIVCSRSCRCLCKAFQSVSSICKHWGQVSSDFLLTLRGIASTQERYLRTCHQSHSPAKTQSVRHWCKNLKNK